MYDIDIKYQKGATNFEADALSRAPANVSLIDIEDIKRCQHEIETTKQLKEEKGMKVVRRQGINKIFVPQSLRRQILQNSHTKFGHIGVKKTLAIISPQYYWPQIITDVSAYIKHCDTCQRCKKSKLKKFGELEKLPPAEQPFDLIAMDTIGGLAGYGSPKRFIHLAIDHATRYIWTFPHKNETSDSYIACVKEIFNAGIPSKFLSDRGSGFVGNKFKRFLKNNHVKQLFTSTQRPQCNGMNERTNQTIVGRLKCKINEGRKVAWTTLLKEVTEEYNNTPHEVTGFSPAFLMFGRQPYQQIIESPIRTIEESRKLAVERSLKYHQKNKIIYDKKFTPAEFNVGDKVLIETMWHPNNGKLTPAMEGPFLILKKISRVSYEVNRPVRPLGRNSDVIHISKIRRYLPPDEFSLAAGEM
ncbi:Retrotransposable element Tf2 protein type 3-like protein [Leptotrombidium deliense]|uniref:RNA-directed DNA polymerase n=1 Tax=Leptotrombidium deliense TaxID=299467 RepID=A0A443S8L6_9ACAR|nr:Retrotransposable element Tf2 protein type 3-like protein [Leptotrombidium deliense]